jgi:hypothetical protein
MEDLRVAGAHIAAATVERVTNAIADDRPIGALANAAVVANLPRRTANIRTGAVFVAHRRRARIGRTFTVRGVTALRHALAGAILTSATSPTAWAAFHPAATELVVPTAPFVMAIAIGIADGRRARIRRMLAVRGIATFRHALVRAIFEAAASSRKRATELPGTTERSLATPLLIVAGILHTQRLRAGQIARRIGAIELGAAIVQIETVS